VLVMWWRRKTKRDLLGKFVPLQNAFFLSIRVQLYFIDSVVFSSLIAIHGFAYYFFLSRSIAWMYYYWFLDVVHRPVKRSGDWILSPSSLKSILSWVQSIELVPLYGHNEIRTGSFD
jgi:hypothetical protein